MTGRAADARRFAAASGSTADWPTGLNRLVMTATLVERGAVRYTPAGLPVIDMVLEHRSLVTEDGQPRKVSMQIRALAIGAMAHAAQSWVLGSLADTAGFLAQARNGRGLLFHLTELVPQPPEVPKA